MAQIVYSVGLDENNKVEVVCMVHRIDPGDEVVVTTKTPNAALQFIEESSFAAPAAGKIYLIPHENADPQILKVEKSQTVLLCGEANSTGNFTAWEGVGLIPGGGTNRPIIGGGGI
jgi:hypothetical protein